MTAFWDWSNGQGARPELVRPSSQVDARGALVQSLEQTSAGQVSNVDGKNISSGSCLAAVIPRR
jgi:hypothetical protein